MLLSTDKRKTFIIGFVATIKSTIKMADEMFSLKENPFHYLLTYKFLQDRLELLFSCLRSKGGWNNNPNSMQLKYNLRQMPFRNAVKASKNSNCIDFSESFTSGIILIFHKRKHRSPLDEETPENDSGFTPEQQLLIEQLEERGHSEFMENILLHIGGYIVTKLITLISCTACGRSLISSTSTQSLDHDYCGMKTTQQSDAPRASTFTLFINRGGLTIPSQSVFAVVKYAEHIFKIKRLSSRMGDTSIQARSYAVRWSWKSVFIFLSMSRTIRISLEIMIPEWTKLASMKITGWNWSSILPTSTSHSDCSRTANVIVKLLLKMENKVTKFT